MCCRGKILTVSLPFPLDPPSKEDERKRRRQMSRKARATMPNVKFGQSDRYRNSFVEAVLWNCDTTFKKKKFLNLLEILPHFIFFHLISKKNARKREKIKENTH